MDQNQSDKTRKNKSRKKKKRSVGKTILISFLVILLILVAIGTGILFGVIKSSPAIDVDILNNLEQTSMMYDKDSNPIESVSGNENRTIAQLKDIPKDLQNAFVSIEDERFYTHKGIDVKRIFGAVLNNIKTMSKSQGASTITQQLIKNYALTKEKKYTRKLQEMYLALQLEKKLSKDQILEAYLNTIFLGGRNIYGVKSAGMHYFGDKELKDLSLAECAFIAGITQNPSKYYPYSERNKKDPSSYIERQHTVLYKMLENGYINQDQYEKAKAEKLNFVDKKPVYSGKYQWFVDPALDEVAKDLASKENIAEKDAKNLLRTGGYKIYLTIDTNLQNAAQKVINDPKYYKGLYPVSDKQYSPNENTTKKIQPQAAAAIYDYNTGEMRAIIGGRGEHEVGATNRATEVPKQPGSTIKPLSVYAPALDRKLVYPSTLISGKRVSSSESGHPGWDPSNVNGQYPESVTVRDALVNSINTVAVRLGIKLTKDTSVDYLENKFHISTLDENDKKYYAALDLGGMSHGVYATEMAAAYGVFGNKGMYSKPIMYTKVLDRNGNIVLENKSTESKSISPEASYYTLEMMEGVVNKNKTASFGSMPTAGKTGTTNDYKTVWFAGLTPYYSGAVWIGHDKSNVKIGGLTNRFPSRIWSDIMKEAHKGLAYKDFNRPAGFSSEAVEICPDSGKLYTPACKEAGVSPIIERYSSASKPTELCDVHNHKAPEETQAPEAPPTTTTPTPPSSGDAGNKPGGNNPNGGNNGGGTPQKPGDNGNNGNNGNGGGSTPNPGDGNTEKPGDDNGTGNEDDEPTPPPTALRNLLNSLFSLIYIKQ